MKKSLVALLILLAANAGAETVLYVSENLEVPVRAGRSLKHKILASISSGTKVIVLGADAKTGYSKVRIGKTEGWMLSRFLQSSPSAKAKLRRIEQKLAEFEIQNTRLKEELKEQTGSKLKIDDELKKRTTEAARLQQELVTIKLQAQNAISTAEKNKQLQARIFTLETDLETAKREIDRLDATENKKFFMYGAGVVVVGIIIGMMFPSLKGRSRRWDTL